MNHSQGLLASLWQNIVAVVQSTDKGEILLKTGNLSHAPKTPNTVFLNKKE